MSHLPKNAPLPLSAPPDAGDACLAPLLASPFARAWRQPPGAGAAALRGRLLGRLAASRQAEAAMVTARRRRRRLATLAPGAQVQTLYEAQPGTPRRPGEPLRVRLIELSAGARLRPEDLGADAAGRHREWLVLSGSARLGGQMLALRDYHVTPAGHAGPGWATEAGVTLFLRESDVAASADDRPFTVLDADAGWPAFVPGIQRRVLWQRDGQAALLYYAQPGAQVPHHTHGHDEECLMVQGELFLDDLLLQPGDYQLAPAGSGHHVTETDTGVVIYAHGDLDLRFVA